MGVVRESDGNALRLVVEAACAAIPGCDAAAVTAVVDERPVIVVGTNVLGRQLEAAQWAAGSGPGIDAMRQLQVFNVTSLVTTQSWPEFTSVALGRGVRCTLSVPVTARGRALGVLDLYASLPGAFTGREPVAIRHAAHAAAHLVGAEWMEAVRSSRPPAGAADGPTMVPAVS